MGLMDVFSKNLIILFLKSSACFLISFLTKYNKNADVLEFLGFNELLNISKLIHTTPNDWLDYPHSSLRAYLYDDVPEFLDKTHISKVYGSAVEYFEFLKV